MPYCFSINNYCSKAISRVLIPTALLLISITGLPKNMATNEIYKEEFFAKNQQTSFFVFHDESKPLIQLETSDSKEEESNKRADISFVPNNSYQATNARKNGVMFLFHFASTIATKKFFETNEENNSQSLEESKAAKYILNFYNFKRKINLTTTKHHAYNLQINGYIQNNVRLRGNNIGVVLHPSAKNLLQFNDAISMLSGTVHQQQYLPYFPAGKFVTELKLEKEKLENLNHPSFSICMRNYFSQTQPTFTNVPQRGYTLFDLCMGSDINILHLQIHTSFFCTNIFGTAYFNHLAIKRGLGVYDDGRNTGVMMQVYLKG